jgi:hypothetical protein
VWFYNTFRIFGYNGFCCLFITIPEAKITGTIIYDEVKLSLLFPSFLTNFGIVFKRRNATTLLDFWVRWLIRYIYTRILGFRPLFRTFLDLINIHTLCLYILIFIFKILLNFYLRLWRPLCLILWFRSWFLLRFLYFNYTTCVRQETITLIWFFEWVLLFKILLGSHLLLLYMTVIRYRFLAPILRLPVISKPYLFVSSFLLFAWRPINLFLFLFYRFASLW